MSEAPASRASSLWDRLALHLPRDKADTLLLLASAVLVLAPHAGHLPLWVSAICAVTLLWRAVITIRGTRLPPVALLLPIAAAAMAGILGTFHTLFGRDAGVAMLVLLVAFKMLEMRAKRDLFVVIFLCYFLVLTNFFYSQGLATALMMIVSIIFLLTAQMSFQFTGSVPPLARRLRFGATILGLAAPLALALFVLFPRIDGPLWGLPGDARGGRTGLSDRMTPGNLSNLAQSEETAFRVKFLDRAPPQPMLYWRGVVLGNFDGRTWTQVSPARPGHRQAGAMALSVRGKPIRQQVTLEPSNNRWLFALELPEQLPYVEGNAATVSSELEMVAGYPIDQRTRYDVSSYLDFSVQAGDTLANAAQWLALPAGSNPRAVAYGAALRKDPDPLKRIKAVLTKFSRDGFVYTLEPPLLGTDSVDELLFASKAGFCEHYAGAFVFLMRAAGIPARVVTGYQGGESNPVDGIMTVRQSDAHAWAEVWLPQRGWLRIDPTAAVAPERVQRGMARALPRKPPFGIEGLGSLMNFELDKNSWLAQARFQLSALNNSWNQWVLNYSPERQRGLLDTVGALLLNWRALAALVLIAALLIVARTLRLRKQTDPVDALYSALCQQMARRGMVRALDEGPHAFAQRLAGLDLAPAKLAAAMRFLALYGSCKYARAAPQANLVTTLKSLLNESR